MLFFDSVLHIPLNMWSQGLQLHRRWPRGLWFAHDTHLLDVRQSHPQTNGVICFALPVQMRHLRLGGNASAAQPQRSPSVQAPVTPSSPAAHTPPRSVNAGQASTSPGGWASRAQDMWQGAPSQQPARPR